MNKCRAIAVFAAASVAPAHAADLPPIQPQAVIESTFQGFYVGAGGAYGLGSGRNFNFGAFYQIPTSFSFGIGSSGTQAVQGASGAVFAGYNLNMGHLLVGLEADGRWGSEAGSNVSAAGIAFYRSSDVGAHVAIRIGAVLDQTMVYLKLGAGANRTNERASLDDRGSLICIDFNVPCGTIPGVTANVGAASWAPAAVFGLGLEHNFGRLFGRVFGEIEATNLQGVTFNSATTFPLLTGVTSSDGLAWTVRAGGALGWRF